MTLPPSRDEQRPWRVAVYGTLRDTAPAGDLMRSLASRRENDTLLAGRLYDTGRGYPAFIPAESAPTANEGIPAEVYVLREPERALSVLDNYEGPEYLRRALTLRDRRRCWVYVWRGSVSGMTELSHGWCES
ncbi:gamma-glutamylcyclotransferase family protein [Actinopolyspora sp. H202]|uniref:gamma-glutamylcyclotransferase family protein n=1 Tax=Actinopolyspora sp. H202 TaxID=1500456 RepID=UPI003EE5C7AF